MELNEKEIQDPEKVINPDLKGGDVPHIDAEMFNRFFGHAAEAVQVALIGEDGRMGRFVMVNDSGIKQIGYSLEEFTEMTPHDIDKGVDSAGEAAFAKEMKEKGEMRFRTRVRHKSGRLVDAELHSSVVFFEGRPAILSIVRNLSDPIHTEELKSLNVELGRERDFIKSVLHSSYNGITVFSPGGTVELMTPGMAKMFGYEQEEIPTVEEWIGKVFPDEDDRVRVRACWEKDSASDDSPPREFLLTRKDGRRRLCRFQMARMESGHIVINGRDVTEEVEPDRRLRESEEKFRSLIEGAGYGVTIIQDGIIQYANPHLLKIGRFKADELIGTPFIDHIHPEFRGLVAESYRRRILGEDVPRTYEAAVMCADGDIIYVDINAGIIELDGKPADFVFLYDVTQRRLVENALRESETLFRTLAEQSLTGFFFMQERELVFVNSKLSEITGYSVEEMMNMPDPLVMVSSAERKERWKAFGSDLDEIRDNTEDIVEIRRKDGADRIIKVHSKLMTYKDKPAVMGSVVDITDRRISEEKLKDYQEQLRSLASELSLIEERERHRIAADLHDRIGQTLAISKIKLGALGQKIEADNSDALDEIRTLIDQAIQDTRMLVFELSPPILYELGLRAALESLIEQFQKEHGINCEFVCRTELGGIDNDIRVVVFQAARELLINVVKHAGATESLVKAECSDGTIKITVEDNGIGFDASRTGSSPDVGSSFGLFSIRERLNHLGGKLKIESEKGKWTRIMISAPSTVRSSEKGGGKNDN